jgi:hypothetical protein
MAGLGVAALAPRMLPFGAVDVGPRLGLPDLPRLPILLHTRVKDGLPRDAMRSPRFRPPSGAQYGNSRVLSPVGAAERRKRPRRKSATGARSVLPKNGRTGRETDPAQERFRPDQRPVSWRADSRLLWRCRNSRRNKPTGEGAKQRLECTRGRPRSWKREQHPCRIQCAHPPLPSH